MVPQAPVLNGGLFYFMLSPFIPKRLIHFWTKMRITFRRSRLSTGLCIKLPESFRISTHLGQKSCEPVDLPYNVPSLCPGKNRSNHWCYQHIPEFEHISSKPTTTTIFVYSKRFLKPVRTKETANESCSDPW
jgi:hypothetical protein